MYVQYIDVKIAEFRELCLAASRAGKAGRARQGTGGLGTRSLVRVLGAPLDGLNLHLLHLELGHAGGLGGLPLETGPSVPHCEHPLVKASTKFRGKENSENAHNNASSYS